MFWIYYILAITLQGILCIPVDDYPRDVPRDELTTNVVIAKIEMVRLPLSFVKSDNDASVEEEFVKSDNDASVEEELKKDEQDASADQPPASR